MTTMTTSELENHVQSKDYIYVETRYRGTQGYDSSIGVMRVMFNIQEDPEAITTLICEDNAEVWTLYSENTWNRIF